jgi:hypothetical protein
MGLVARRSVAAVAFAFAAFIAGAGCRPAGEVRQVAFIVPEEEGEAPNLESCNALCKPAIREGERVAKCQLLDSFDNVESELVMRLVYGHRVYVCSYR